MFTSQANSKSSVPVYVRFGPLPGEEDDLDQSPYYEDLGQSFPFKVHIKTLICFYRMELCILKQISHISMK